jgi:hypothetical protein
VSDEWTREDVPNEAALFMRVHQSLIRDGEPIPGAFRDQGSGMSTNWEKYCPTPEHARQKARDPAKNGVIRFLAGDVRAFPPLTVEHTPDLERGDRSHTDVVGRKDAEVRLKLLRIFKWAIRLQ